MVEEETEEAEKYETVEIEYSEDDIEAISSTRTTTRSGLSCLTRMATRSSTTTMRREAAKGESDEDNPYDLGITEKALPRRRAT